MKKTLAYVLHSGQLFGTERMALATLRALDERFTGLVIAPPGPLHAACEAAGVASRVAYGRLGLARILGCQLRRDPHTALFTTGVWQSLLAHALRGPSGWRGAHVHVVHGGTDERLSYGRKRWLTGLPLRMVAVSEFVRDRLVAHGVPAERIEVIHNFLDEQPIVSRPAFICDGVRRVVMLSRLDRIKRVGLLLDALDRVPGLDRLHFEIYGSGEEWQALRQRALQHPNVQFHGFVPDARAALAHADLLLHTCPEEPFGLALLEAFAAGVPVLAPNSGGAGAVVRDGVNGSHFSANDPVSLGLTLRKLSATRADQLNDWAAQGRLSLQQDYDPPSQAQRYAALTEVAA